MPLRAFPDDAAALRADDRGSMSGSVTIAVVAAVLVLLWPWIERAAAALPREPPVR